MPLKTNHKGGASYVEIGAAEADRRLDNFLLGRLRDVPRSRVYRMIRNGEVRVNSARVSAGYRLRPGDRVRVPPHSTGPARQVPAVSPETSRRVLDAILHEEEGFLVLDKPAGLPVHSGTRFRVGLIDALRAARPDGESLQLVHRLDRETSGCLLVARDPATLRRLHALLRDGRLEKRYLALLKGRVSKPFTMDEPLERDRARTGRKVDVSPEGKPSLTRFRPVRSYRGATLVEALPATGRTHQIRVHAAAAGHPLAGDYTYGDPEFNRRLRAAGLDRLFLHAAGLRIPFGPGHTVRVEAPLPPDLEAVLAGLG
jgi:23S rRNA pseudouridine955/2504/2580 synthase